MEAIVGVAELAGHGDLAVHHHLRDFRRRRDGGDGDGIPRGRLRPLLSLRSRHRYRAGYVLVGREVNDFEFLARLRRLDIARAQYQKSGGQGRRAHHGPQRQASDRNARAPRRDRPLRRCVLSRHCSRARAAPRPRRAARAVCAPGLVRITGQCAHHPDWADLADGGVPGVGHVDAAIDRGNSTRAEELAVAGATSSRSASSASRSSC